jgi:acyl-CoA reductase-like NAD-dependent aldehyde dehydrogenase
MKKMLIAGEWVAALSGRALEVDNPATGAVLDTVPRAEAADVDLAVTSALAGAKENARLPAHERYRYLTAVADLILRDVEELTTLLVAENGKSRDWADFEVRKGAEVFRTIAERVKDPQGASYPMDSMYGAESAMSMIYKQPLGVIAAIVPFNFPVELLAYKVAGALAGGNGVVVKLPEDCPLTCLRIGELLLEAGAPATAFQLVTGLGDEAGAPLVRHPSTAMISFTGSTEVGRAIATEAGRQLKRVALELGGNDAVIVFDDADVRTAAEAIVRGRMTVGNGQACVADKVWLVHESIADDFAAAAAETAGRLRFGDPEDPTVDVGPLITKEAADRVLAQIDAAVEQGAKVVVGGTRFGERGVAPTVLTGVGRDSTLVTDECFGPVVPIVRFSTEQEAVEIANSSRYGLQGAVFTNDISRAMRVADQLEVGGVVVNGSSCFRPGNVPYMPRKESGLGADNMFHALEEMTAGKAVIINGVRTDLTLA